MSSTAAETLDIDVVLATRDEAHAWCIKAFTQAKAILANEQQARLTLGPYELDRTIQQNRFYWGPVLGDIADQVILEGERWTKEAWHELCKRKFAGYEIKKVRVAGRKSKVVIRRLRSTTDFKVKPFSVYLEKVMAWAVTELGVKFSETRWEDYRGQ